LSKQYIRLLEINSIVDKNKNEKDIKEKKEGEKNNNSKV